MSSRTRDHIGAATALTSRPGVPVPRARAPGIWKDCETSRLGDQLRLLAARPWPAMDGEEPGVTVQLVPGWGVELRDKFRFACLRTAPATAAGYYMFPRKGHNVGYGPTRLNSYRPASVMLSSPSGVTVCGCLGCLGCE